MEVLSVLAAAVASYAFGAVWYMTWAKQWMADTGIEVGEDGKPADSGDPTPYIIAFVGSVLVAGMMRHVFSLSGIDGMGKGLVAGLGIGLFLAAPWIASNVAFAGRPKRLILIDGGFAAFGCAVTGLVLGQF